MRWSTLNGLAPAFFLALNTGFFGVNHLANPRLSLRSRLSLLGVTLRAVGVRPGVEAMSLLMRLVNFRSEEVGVTSLGLRCGAGEVLGAGICGLGREDDGVAAADGGGAGFLGEVSAKFGLTRIVFFLFSALALFWSTLGLMRILPP